MTDAEEAVVELEEMRRQSQVIRDNPTIFIDSKSMSDGIQTLRRHIMALDVALAALRREQECEQNAPLALEELRGMDREPVWIMRLDDKRGWWVIARLTLHRLTTDYGGYFMLDDYGKTWLAYRRPPEQ